MAKSYTHSDGSPFTYEDVQEIAAAIQKQTKHKPDVLIICGSGLSNLSDDIEDQEIVEYANCPGFPVSAVQGHGKRLVFGKLGGKTVVAMQGRFHYYQGYSMHVVTLPVRVMKLMGCTKMIVTNAAGGLNQTYQVGTIMIIDDHVNMPGMAGVNPLRGDNDERWGPRFPSLNDAYCMDRNAFVMDVAKEIGIDMYMRRGTYAFVSGPSYETPAECFTLQQTGSDAVGMSTVPEVIVAHHCGLQVIGMSLITNVGILDKHTSKTPNHIEVLEVAGERGKDMRRLISSLCPRWT